MIKVGIFFGGQSREREISFAGGRTVYDNLNKELFEAVPIFVDSLGQFILLNWENLYKGTIRDFYPSIEGLQLAGINPLQSPFQYYAESLPDEFTQGEKAKAIGNSIGKVIEISEFKSLFDIAFLALHGPYGEDGTIQGILEWVGIPYTGSGILPSAIGIDKSVQSKLMRTANFARPLQESLDRYTWLSANLDKKKQLLEYYQFILGLPIVIKAPMQGSSIGISILQNNDINAFIEAVNKAFFIVEIARSFWESLNNNQRINYLRTLSDIREGIGLPVIATASDGKRLKFNDALSLLNYLNNMPWKGTMRLEALDGEHTLLIESFIKGKEFSCIVIEDDLGKAIALPPTEIIKKQDLFDYRSKYLPGMSRKVTPINVSDAQLEAIRNQCVELFGALQFSVYARIDGFITDSGEIFLNDPNTTSGMLPSSFFFHQAAEIGLNPSQFLTYIIRASLKARLANGKRINKVKALLDNLDSAIQEQKTAGKQKTKIAVIMGGYSSERHISVESGRNIFEKLASSIQYEPVPFFLTGSSEAFELFQLPINIMLKDNADDIRDKVLLKYKAHPLLKSIREEAAHLTQQFAGTVNYKPEKVSIKQLSRMVDAVFIALHGRPGEDGALQAELEKVGLPYNGSGINSSQTTINKYQTNKKLRDAGLLVAAHAMVEQVEWEMNQDVVLTRVEALFQYPFIAKPHDDGCSSAVKKIKNRAELIAFCEMMFRPSEEFLAQAAAVLHLKAGEEFPIKRAFLIESLIEKETADHFLEITGGMLTHLLPNGTRTYEMFEPSEALATGEVLSLEEKFLAGEGQNITPARYSTEKELQALYSKQVREVLQKVCEVLNVEGYCRIDAFVRIYNDTQKAETIIIEVNSLPGMTPATCIFHQAAINGYKPAEFIDGILRYAFNKKAVDSSAIKTKK